MTIKPGEPWGTNATTPPHLVVADDEAAAARLVQHGTHMVAIRSGDLLRALGRTSTNAVANEGGECLLLPCDMLQVSINDTEEVSAVSSVVVGRWHSPQWWVSAGGFLGALNIAPRAHPNDGQVDALTFAPNIGLRQLLAIRSRMRRGDHLPHPALRMQRGERLQWTAPRAVPITIDGRRHGRAHRIVVNVLPDAFTLCVPR